MTDFTLPELGENIAAGDVLRVLVKPGDTVAKDQPVLELETDKATVEVPSSVAGQVKNVNVKAGDKVKVGQVILTVEGGAAAPAAAPKPAPPPAAASAPAPQPSAQPKPAGEPKPQPAVSATSTSSVPDEPGFEQHVSGLRRTGQDKPGTTPSKIVDIRGARGASEPAPSGHAAPAAPSVRRMARELGLDINDVPGTGADGRISVDDVKAHAKRVISGGARAASGGAPAAAPPLPDFSRWGEVERQPMRAVRRKTAEHLAAAWATIPHVTQHDLADITDLEALRQKYAKQAEAAGGALTITAIVLKVIAAALRKFPQFNSSIDLAADELVFRKYVHIGVAVDTDRGLLVPVIRDVDTKGIFEIARELTELSEKARTRKIAAEEMQGGCFSVSNLGGLGGTSFTPIVNAPEVAILGISRARMEPVWQRDADSFAPRLMLPLSLSYDHRVIDGADAVRFLRWVIDALEQPFVLALNG